MAHFKIDAESYRPVEAHGAERWRTGQPGARDAAEPRRALPPRIDLRIADTVPVAIDPAALHFFDEETGAALT